MKTQFQILIFFVCLNLSVYLAVKLELPGVSDVTPNVEGSPAMNVTQYREHFNATETVERYEENTEGINILVGFISSGLTLIFRDIQYLILGFPLFLVWVGNNFILDTVARTAYTYIIGVLVAIFYILMSVYVVEFISGRYHTN